MRRTHSHMFYTHHAHRTTSVCRSPEPQEHTVHTRLSPRPFYIIQPPHLQWLDDQIRLEGGDGPAEEHESGGGALELHDAICEGEEGTDEEEEQVEAPRERDPRPVLSSASPMSQYGMVSLW